MEKDFIKFVDTFDYYVLKLTKEEKQIQRTKFDKKIEVLWEKLTEEEKTEARIRAVQTFKKLLQKQKDEYFRYKKSL